MAYDVKVVFNWYYQYNLCYFLITEVIVNLELSFKVRGIAPNLMKIEHSEI